MDLPALLSQVTDISRLPHLPDWTSHLQSSYDRTGANGDFGKFISMEGGEGVMADMDGPGAIVRIWSANPGGHIKIYIDGSGTPVVDTAFRNLFNDTLEPFSSPLCGKSSGGVYSYLPIPYAKHCRVVLTHSKDVYYQVNYLTFRGGTPVRSFTLPLSAGDKAAVDAANKVWSSLDSPKPAMPDGGTHLRVEPKATALLTAYSGPGLVRSIALAAPEASDADLRGLILRAYFDGHDTPDIQAPVADFFGNAFSRKPFRTLLLGSALDGSFHADFPMPYRTLVRFTLENLNDKAIDVVWQNDTIGVPFHDGDGYFHALWTQETTTEGHPHIWARVTGQHGKFVGVVQTMQSRLGLGYLEGDDQFRVDNQAWLPSKVSGTVVGPWNGTGAEDCFNSGWYFRDGPISLPLNAVLVKDGYQGRIDCLRWFLADAPVFQASLDGQIEHGGANDAPGAYYSSVSYWYSDGPVQPWSEALSSGQLTFPPLRGPQLIIANAIEGESMPAKVTAGAAWTQGTAAYGDTWSGSAHLFWNGAIKPADTLTLTFTPPAAGKYDLVGYFTKAGDYGQVSFQINGKPLPVKFDGYAPDVSASGPVDLGPVTLPAGPSILTVTATGKNAQSANYFFGLDALALNAPGTQPTPVTAP